MALRSVLLIAFVAMVPSGFARADEPKPVSFREQVAPILVKSCLGCHNDKKAENGLNMTTVSLLKKGGKSSGAAILVAGEPDESELILSVRPDAEPRMPMKLPPLTDAAIQTLETWVLQGAKFDNPSDPDVPLASLVDPLKGLPDVTLMTRVIEPVTSVEFSPDEVHIQWRADKLNKNDPDKMVTLARWNVEQVRSQYEMAKKDLETLAPGSEQILPNWSPKLSFGIISRRSIVAIRNVMVIPLSDRNP